MLFCSKHFFCFPFVKGVSLLEPALVLVLALALALSFWQGFHCKFAFCQGFALLVSFSTFAHFPLAKGEGALIHF